MIGSALVRQAQEWWLPRWMNAARVRSDRRRLMPGSRCALRAPTRVFIDVSVISRHDAGTGIQRFVRSIGKELLAQSNGGVDFIPVAATRKRCYALARWPAEGNVTEWEMEASAGDVFLGLDLSLDSIWRQRNQIAMLVKKGVRCWYVVYDLLPHQHPQWFSDGLVVRYRRWLRVISTTAYGFFCISSAVANDLREWLEIECQIPEQHMPRIEVVPMGWDIEHGLHSTGVGQETRTIVARASRDPFVLMVGTIEPRKGHQDVVSAFNRLWHEGTKLNLVIAGRPGWKTGALQQSLRQHPLSGRRLFWLQNATDEEVIDLYQACSGVICASYAEGFGLTIIEALGLGKPVLARDIEVFRMHSSSAVRYFPATATAAELAQSIDSWIRNLPSPDPLVHPPPTWREAASFMKRLIQRRTEWA